MVDARGHGERDKPRVPSAFHLELRVKDFVAVLDKEGIDRAHYFGYSMGGWMGLGYLRYAPDRFPSLVIGASHPYFRDAEPMRQGFRAGVPAWVTGVEKLFGDKMTPALKTRLLNNDAGALIAAHEDRADFHTELEHTTNPCLFVVGGDDPLCADVKRFALGSPGTELSVLPGLDHAGAFLRADLLAPIVKDFFGRHRLQSAGK